MIGMGAGLFGLLIAFMLYKKVDSIEIENETVATITGRIQDGAMAFLFAEYRMLSIFIVGVAALLFVGGEINEDIGLSLNGRQYRGIASRGLWPLGPSPRVC